MKQDNPQAIREFFVKDEFTLAEITKGITLLYDIEIPPKKDPKQSEFKSMNMYVDRKFKEMEIEPTFQGKPKKYSRSAVIRLIEKCEDHFLKNASKSRREEIEKEKRDIDRYVKEYTIQRENEIDEWHREEERRRKREAECPHYPYDEVDANREIEKRFQDKKKEIAINYVLNNLIVVNEDLLKSDIALHYEISEKTNLIDDVYEPTSPELKAINRLEDDTNYCSAY